MLLFFGCVAAIAIASTESLTGRVIGTSVFAFFAFLGVPKTGSIAVLRSSPLKYNSFYLRRHRDQLIKDIQNNSHVFRDAISNNIRNDPGIALEAIKQDVSNFTFASEEIQSSPVFVLEALQHGVFHILDHIEADLLRDPKIQEQLKDRAFVLSAIKIRPNTMELAPPDWLSDRDFCLELVKGNPATYQYLSDPIRSERDILLYAAALPGYFDSASSELRSEREAVLRAVSRNGSNLGVVSPELRSDREIVLAAVRSNLIALLDAPDALQIDKEVVLEGLRHHTDWRDWFLSGFIDYVFLKWIPDEWWAEDDFYFEAVELAMKIYNMAREEQNRPSYGDDEWPELPHDSAEENLGYLLYVEKDSSEVAFIVPNCLEWEHDKRNEW